MLDVDIIIPCYGPSSVINKGLAVLAAQWKKEFIHVILVDDASPNTDCHYQDLVDIYIKMGLDIRVVVSEKNQGQGLTRQLGIDSSTHDIIMFQDEDDMYASPITISQFVGQYEVHDLDIEPDGRVNVDEEGNPKKIEGMPKIAVISGSVFEWDDLHTHVIPSANTVWMNSKLYNKKFFEKYNIRFNSRQSRHAEDYFFTKCLYLALEFDDEYCALMLDDQTPWYFWYPNENSQSRKDPHYGHMLSGYTMDGSVNVLAFLRKNFKKHPKFNDIYYRELLNMTGYSYFTFMSFIKEVIATDYVPALAYDWHILRDACKKLATMTYKNLDKYSYMQITSELVHIKEYSDVHYVEPWMSFEYYLSGKAPEFKYSLDDLLALKDMKGFDEFGRRLKDGKVYFNK